MIGEIGPWEPLITVGDKIVCVVCRVRKPETAFTPAWLDEARRENKPVKCMACRGKKRTSHKLRQQEKKREASSVRGLAALERLRSMQDTLLCVVCNHIKPRSAFNAAGLKFTGEHRAQCGHCKKILAAHRENKQRESSIMCAL